MLLLPIFTNFKYADAHSIVIWSSNCSVLWQCVLFQGSNKTNYTRLSLYVTWLTHTPAADKMSQKVISTDEFMNLRYTLDMKTSILATCRTSALKTLSRRTVLIYAHILRLYFANTPRSSLLGRQICKWRCSKLSFWDQHIEVHPQIYTRTRTKFQPLDSLSRDISLFGNGVTVRRDLANITITSITDIKEYDDGFHM